MTEFKAITFFDLDGTLLDGQSNITPEVTSAIEKLKKNNILPVIATGRTEVEVKDIMEAANIDSAIVMNGAFIRVNGEEIYSDVIESSICERMATFVYDQKHELSFYNENKIWCTGHSQNLLDAYNFIHTPIPAVDPLGYLNQKVNMLLVLSQFGDQAYHESFPELTFYRNGPYSIDIVNRGISKGSGIQKMKEALRLTHVPTFGFGDGPNDLPLLTACDYKIAMGNAYTGLKEVADFITHKNTENGVIHALKYYDLI